ncbi:GNAT family N-acetyltransferase [Flavisolibacter sp. BT320]|nr:GNAT family N-acetyltransferase [Flavisolibacter longurius]
MAATVSTIRRATQADSEAMASCLLLAMEEIVFAFIGEKTKAKAAAFMNYFTLRENNQYSFQNGWVVEENGKVVAAANVYNGADLHRLRQPVLDYIRSQYHRNLLPEDETIAGEFYLDTLGVLPEHRDKGIGSCLLQSLLEEYVYRQQQTLGLLVEESNPAALRLYLRIGFVPAGEKMLLGKKMHHLQVKAVAKPESFQ